MRQIIFLVLFSVNLVQSLPRQQRQQDCHSSDQYSSKKCASLTNPWFNRTCYNYEDCKFQPEGCESPIWFHCDGTQCQCQLFDYDDNDYGKLSVSWIQNHKDDLCTIDRGGPCGRNDGLELRCLHGFECIDSQCQKMPRRQNLRGGCSQKDGCEFGSVTPPCHDPRGCEFGRSTHSSETLLNDRRKLKPDHIRNGGSSNDNGRRGRITACDEISGSCEFENVRPSKGKSRSRPKPRKMEMESEEMASRDDNGGSGGSGIFPPSMLRPRQSTDSGCGKEKSEEECEKKNEKPKGGCEGGKGRGGCGSGGSGTRKPKPMGPRPNAPKPCRGEGGGNCGGGKKTTTTRATTKKPCGRGGSCGGRRKTTTTARPSDCGNKRGAGGCGRRTTERADKPPCDGNINLSCGEEKGDKPSGCSGGGSKGGSGCGSGSGSGPGQRERPKKRPGPTRCKEGGSGCDVEVNKSKGGGCGKGGSGSCGRRTTTSTTPPPMDCKESNSCEGEMEAKSKEGECDEECAKNIKYYKFS